MRSECPAEKWNNEMIVYKALVCCETATTIAEAHCLKGSSTDIPAHHGTKTWQRKTVTPDCSLLKIHLRFWAGECFTQTIATVWSNNEKAKGAICGRSECAAEWISTSGATFPSAETVRRTSARGRTTFRIDKRLFGKAVRSRPSSSSEMAYRKRNLRIFMRPGDEVLIQSWWWTMPLRPDKHRNRRLTVRERVCQRSIWTWVMTFIEASTKSEEVNEKAYKRSNCNNLWYLLVF